MTVAYQMPVSGDPAQKVGPRMWWKPVLRKGRISKGGVTIDVDDALMRTYVTNFRAGAKDQVQFLAGHADDKDLDAFRGDLRGLEVRDDEKLWALFSVTEQADRTLDQNPRLGASVSVVDRFERADGRNFGPTLLHVAGTFDPEVGQLGDWVRAELSASSVEVIDLTTSPDSTAGSGGATTDAAPGGDAKGDAVASLTDEQVNKLLSLLKDDDKPEGEQKPEGTTTDGKPEGKGGDKGDRKVTERPAELVKPADKPVEKRGDEGDGEGSDDEPSFTDAELEAIASGIDPAEVQRVAASAEREALELANQRLDAQQVELAALRRKDDEREFEALRDRLARAHGVPPAVTNLCRDLLQGSNRLDLSAGKTVNPAEVITKALTEFAKVGRLDLSSPVGSSHEVDAETQRQSENDDFRRRAHESGFAH